MLLNYDENRLALLDLGLPTRTFLCNSEGCQCYVAPLVLGDNGVNTCRESRPLDFGPTPPGYWPSGLHVLTGLVKHGLGFQLPMTVAVSLMGRRLSGWILDIRLLTRTA